MVGDARTRAMSTTDFLAWEDRQDARHEFVDGAVRAMVGVSDRHDRIAMNIARHMGNRLAGGPCRVSGPERRVITPRGNVRYPDMKIVCGASSGPAVTDPRVIIEVQSPSNTFGDLLGRQRDYASIPSVTTYLVISQDRRAVTVFRRSRDGTALDPDAEVVDPDAEIALPEVGAVLPLADIYDGIEFATFDGP